MANKPIHYHLASKEVKFGKFAGKTILQAIAQRTPATPRTPATKCTKCQCASHS